MSEMVERVVEALHASRKRRHYGEDAAGDIRPPSAREREFYRDDVRAVIEAMREPTREMLNAAVDTGSHLNSDYYITPDSYEEPWRAMIDAALGGENV